MPDPSNYLNIGGLLEKDWSDDIIVFDDKDLIEFTNDKNFIQKAKLIAKD